MPEQVVRARCLRLWDRTTKPCQATIIRTRIGGPMDRPYRESASFHALDIGTNYFGLWTEADNIRRYYEKYPDSLRAMEQRLGYRVRPSIIWQRKRYDTMELIVGHRQ